MSLGGGTGNGNGNGNGKSRGWAAFDRDQRRKLKQKQGLLPQNDVVVDDPFPPLPSSSSSSTSTPPPILSYNNILTIPKLKEPLIQHVMATVDHDLGKASTQTDETNPEKKKTDTPAPLFEMPQVQLKDNSFECELSEDMKRIMERLNSLPIEPEWEDNNDDDDDVYLSHRKQALRTMRSASQHSKAATNAFLKGNHFSAHQHSLKAQQLWLAAQTLNANAAKDIFSIRNSQHDVWNLDLHGLHATEAIQVLRQRLHHMETHLLSNRSLSPNSLKMESRNVGSSVLESFDSMELLKLDKEHASLRQRPTSLQVITGVGNHSRGQASLPAAVRGFLCENGYHFEELKPGVISVRPKFRVSS